MKKKAVFKLTGIILGGIAALCIVIGAVLFCIGGGFQQQKYMEPWKKDYATSAKNPRIALASAGLLAASGHNMQPWKIKLDTDEPSVFYLYADSQRRTDAVDPEARQMMISEGTFLGYVSVAGEQYGYHADIALFPNGSYDESKLSESMDTKPVAKITLSKTEAKPTALFDGVYQPDTNRNAYKKDALTQAQQNAIKSLPTADGISVKLYTDAAELQKIGDYAIKSAAVEAGVQRVMDESNAIFRANETEKNKYRYGYSVEGQGSSGLMKDILQGMLTVFPSLNTGEAASKNFIDYTKTSVENTPAYEMIVTKGNSRAEQVESGMLYSMMVLTGHAQGLVMQPLSQVLEEYPEMQSLYTGFKQAYAPDGGTVQMLLRVGIPTKSVPLSMRRDVADLIMK